MAAMAGRDVRIKIDNGLGTLVELNGATTDGFEITREGIPITDKDDAGVQRFLATDIGTWAMTMSAEGVLKDTTAVQAALPAANAEISAEIMVGSLGTFTGNFVLTSLSVNGPDGAEAATYSISLASSGAVTFA